MENKRGKDKMKKKNLLLLICLLLVGALMVGCSKENADSADNTAVAMGDELGQTLQGTLELADEGVTDEGEIETQDESDEEAVMEEEIKEETKEGKQRAEGTDIGKDSSINKSAEKTDEKYTRKPAPEPKENKKTQEKKTETPKEINPAPKPTPEPEPEESTPAPEPEQKESKQEESKQEEPKQGESEKKGLLGITPKELKRMLDEEYPGDNIPQWWIDTHCGEKLYEYTWGKYGSKGMINFYRTAERVINENTIECDITITLEDNSMRFHKIRLQVDDNKIWTVISDKIVD